VYAVGEDLDLIGLVITGTYSDETTKAETVSASNISGYDANTVDEQTVTVTVGGKTATFTVTVSEPLLGLADLASANGGDTADNPVLLTLSLDLANGGWEAIRYRYGGQVRRA
jgi:hypothetical protein